MKPDLDNVIPIRRARYLGHPCGTEPPDDDALRTERELSSFYLWAVLLAERAMEAADSDLIELFRQHREEILSCVVGHEERREVAELIALSVSVGMDRMDGIDLEALATLEDSDA